MKIIVGLGGAPKNPSHSNMVTVAHRLRSGHCHHKTLRIRTPPLLDQIYAVRYLTSTLSYQTTPQRNFTVLYHTITILCDTLTRPDRMAQYLMVPHHNSTVLYQTATLLCVTVPLLGVTTLHLGMAVHNFAVTDLYYTTT
nr:MAG TPA: hypothetical protein [Bacteriophage sp.]